MRWCYKIITFKALLLIFYFYIFYGHAKTPWFTLHRKWCYNIPLLFRNPTAKHAARNQANSGLKMEIKIKREGGLESQFTIFALLALLVIQYRVYTKLLLLLGSKGIWSY